MFSHGGGRAVARCARVPEHMAGGEEGRRTRTAWPWIAVGALALLVVLAGTGSGVFRDFRRGPSDRGSVLTGALVGGLAGAAVAAVILGVIALIRRRRGLAAGALGGGLVAALLALLIGAGASLGAATAPPAATSPPTPSSEPLDSVTGNNRVPAFGGAIDAASGRVFVDTDGDGRLDTELIPCPPPDTSDPASATTTPETVPPLDIGDTVRIPIDNDCDGRIDGYVDATVRDNLGINAPPPTAPPTTATAVPEDDGGSTGIGRLLLIVLAAIALCALGAGVTALARRPYMPKPLEPLEPPADDGVDGAAVADSLASSARRLLDDPDPRRAIIAAYAELLEGLAAAGVPRASYEAPEEHLQRALRQLGVPPEPLSEVTRLFLIARFSENPLGETERRQAQSALNEAERILRAAIARAAAEAAEQTPPWPAPAPPRSPGPPPGPFGAPR